MQDSDNYGTCLPLERESAVHGVTLPDYNFIVDACHNGSILEVVNNVINNSTSAINDSILSDDWSAFLLVLEQSCYHVHSVCNTICFLTTVLDDDYINHISKFVLQERATFFSLLLQDTRLYQQIEKMIHNTSDPLALKCLTNWKHHFNERGIALHPDDQDELHFLDTMIEMLQFDFSQNVYHAKTTNVLGFEYVTDLDGLGANTLDYIKQFQCNFTGTDSQLVWIPLQDHVVVDILTNCIHESTRKQVYDAFFNLCSHGQYDNSEQITNLLDAREQYAALSNYQDFHTMSCVANNTTPHDVNQFVVSLYETTKPLIIQLQTDIQQFCNSTCESLQMDSHNRWHIIRKYQQHLQPTEVPLFPINTVFNALYSLIDDLLDVQGLRISSIDKDDRWHEDVIAHQLFHNGQKIGILLFDLYVRNDKQPGAFTHGALSNSNNGVKLPVSHIVCNFSSNMLTHDNMITLFHEVGHALQHTLAQHRYPSLSGIDNITKDITEVIPLVMEHFAWDYDILQQVALDCKLSDQAINELIQTRKVQHLIFLLKQVEMTLFDFHIHSNNVDTTNINRALSEIREQYNIFQYNPDENFAHSCTSLFTNDKPGNKYGQLLSYVYACNIANNIDLSDTNDQHKIIKQHFFHDVTLFDFKEQLNKFMQIDITNVNLLIKNAILHLK